jgi:High-affinity nickel-transport protein
VASDDHETIDLQPAGGGLRIGSSPGSCRRVVCTIELGGIVAEQLNLSGSFWNWFETIDINLLGFIIVGMFVATWAIALSVWRFSDQREHTEAASGSS